MAKASTRKPKRKSSCFLDCFGFSDKASEKKLLPEVPKSESHRKITRWLSRRWSFHFKKSATKTVSVVDANVPGKPSKRRREIIHYLKSSDQKLSSVIHTPVAGNKVAEIQVVEEDRTLDTKVAEKNRNPQKIKIIENHDRPRKSTGETKNGLFSCRKNGVKAKTVDDLNWQLVRKKTSMTRCKSQPAIFQSTALVPPKPKKPMASKTVATYKMSKSGKFDSLIGMSIILVTLFIMVLWGKVCAILCTSAWFFFVPRLRSTTESNDCTEKGSNSDIHDSEEYKRKVVLEGFLTRNHRKVVGFL